MVTYPIGGAYSEWRDAYALIRRIYDASSALTPATERVVRQVRRLAPRTGDYEASYYRRSQYRRPRVVAPIG